MVTGPVTALSVILGQIAALRYSANLRIQTYLSVVHVYCATNIQKGVRLFLKNFTAFAVTGAAHRAPAQFNCSDRRAAHRFVPPAVHHRYRDTTTWPFSVNITAVGELQSPGWRSARQEDGHTVAQLLIGVEDPLMMTRRQPPATVHPAAIASAGSSARGQSPAFAVRRRTWCPLAGYAFMQARKQPRKPI